MNTTLNVLTKMDSIFQVKITLRGTEPPIWRRVLVEKTMTFEQLHAIIQLSMGWTNSHLHEFSVNSIRIGQPLDDFDEEYGAELIDETTVTLESVLSSPDSTFNYTYDFGDSWEHELTIENRLPFNDKKPYPICIGGKLNCPPEDCGGIPGFYQLLSILSDKRHPERNEMLAWLGGLYDAQQFDQEEVNEQLVAFFH